MPATQGGDLVGMQKLWPRCWPPPRPPSPEPFLGEGKRRRLSPSVEPQKVCFPTQPCRCEAGGMEVRLWEGPA